MAENINRDEIIKGEAMDKALLAAAEIKKTILTTYKERDKANVDQFYETVLHSRQDIIDIMDKKKKNRADVEEQMLRDFKKNTTRSYKMVCEMIAPEDVEDGKPTKISKLVDRIALVIDYLRYIGFKDLDQEFEKRGLRIESTKLEDRSEVWANEDVKKNVKNIFDNGRKVREQVKDDTAHIVENIYALEVPQELVYEKDSNPVGLKKSDWTKLVDIRTKLLMATVDEQKEKVEDQANELAAEKQFDQERARLMQTKLTSMEGEQA